MRVLVPLLLSVPLLLAASGPVQSRAEPLDLTLARAQAEARAAEAEQRKLERAAEQAANAADRLRAAQLAAAQAIAAAEARISASEALGRLTAARLAGLRQRLRQEQQPVSSLLAGLAMMARRPPLLALAGGTDTDEMVRVRVLLDSTLPVIRRRTAALAGEMDQVREMELALTGARQQMAAARSDLQQRQRDFAQLEAQALRSEAGLQAQALAAGDLALTEGEDVERLESGAGSRRAAQALARELARLGPAPLRPAASAAPRPALEYRLPVSAPVIEGFGAVNDSGVRSRGISFASGRGVRVEAPAAGIIRFAGPFRDYDGILIIDHGDGWMSLIVNVASQLQRGRRVAIGEPLGRSLGPIQVELSRHGRRVSPALIAGSSGSLSKTQKAG